MRLTQKQIGFVLDVVKEVPAGKAYMTHYRVKSMAVADVCASKLLRTAKIQAYLQDLRKKLEDESIADPVERRQILTEIARARLTDYTTCGPDRDLIDVGPESPNTAALQELTSRTEFDKDGAGNAVITKLKLHNPMQAIDILNKMGGDYAPEKHAYLVKVQPGDLTDEQLADIALGDKPSGGRKRIAEETESTQEPE